MSRRWRAKSPMMPVEVHGGSRRLYTSHETDQPPACSIHLGSDLRARLHHSELDRELDLTLQLTGGPNRDPQKSGQLFLGSSARALSDVRADGYDGRSHLGHQPESFPRWEILRQAIDSLAERDAVSPDVETPKITLVFLDNRLRRRLEPPCVETRRSHPVAQSSSLMARSSLLVARRSRSEQP